MALGTLDALRGVPHIGDGTDTVVGDAGGVAGDSFNSGGHTGSFFDDFVAKQRFKCWIFC